MACYLADDLSIRRVAIKVLRPELAAALGADRFLAEIRTTAGLQHPHILPLYDSGEAAGSLYYVMPFVDGESVGTGWAGARFRGRSAQLRGSRRCADVCTQPQVIHRDIKPENILLR